MLQVLAVMDSASDVARARIAVLEKEVRKLRKLLRDQNRVVLKIDEEGGSHFDLVDKDRASSMRTSQMK